MANKNSTLVFPEVINNFNVYDGGDRLQGVSAEVTLPNMQAITAEITGAGVLGSYNTAVVGMYQSITQEIPFRIINREFFSLINSSKQAEIVLRASQQNVNRQTGGTISSQGMRVVFRGRPSGANLGTLKQADMMNASVTLELTYLLVEIGGETAFELDKLNEVCKINGVDVLADIRNQC